ncbi:MAG TPA: fasciclin domain-containing protein [Chloroflexia bacterium]|nr:fasciclin domain-containing protein [Chloroflexia bacterium]
MDCFAGHYPGHIGQEYNVETSYSTSSRNTGDFLQLLNAGAGNGGQGPAFTTFATALKTTGLSDTLATGGPYMIFPPTDEAFAALPAEQRTTLLNDRQALAGVLRSIIVPGYYPAGSLSGGTGGNVNRTVMNLLGQPLALLATDNGFTLNGMNVGDDGYVMTANGSRVFTGIKMVGMPGPAPGMPTTGAGANPENLLAALGAGLALLLAGGLLRR